MTDSIARQQLPVPLAYRRADRAQVLAALVLELAQALAPGRRLATKSPSDPTVALLDAWAAVADVVDFYQERIATESYLTTATEPESVLALATLVGYRPRPGLAATCWLAYTLVADPTDTAVLLPQYQLVQSVPAAGELPQTFETSEDLVARPSWNTLPVRTTKPPTLAFDSPTYTMPTELVISGVVSQLNPNDVILITPSGDTNQCLAARVNDITTDMVAMTTTVGLQQSATTSDQPQPSTDQAQPSSDQAQPSSDLLVTATQLFTPLKTNPSTPPATATAVARDPNTIYPPSGDGPGELTDTSIKLLAALHPGLSKALYPAMATTTIGTSDISSVQAMRVTTAPFGVQIPPRARFDNQGQPLPPAEWPLNDNQILRITISVSQNDAGNITMPETGFVPSVVRIDALDNHGAVTIDANNSSTPVPIEGGNILIAAADPSTFGQLQFNHTTSGLEDVSVTISNDQVNATIDGTSLSAPVDPTGSATSASTPGVSLNIRFLAPVVPGAEVALVIEVISALPVDNPTVLYLNERHDEIVPRSYVMIDEVTDNQANAQGGGQAPAPPGTPLDVNPSTDTEPFYPRVAKVVKAGPEAINRYGMSVTTTRLDLGCDWVSPTARLLSDVRPLTVYAQSVALDVAQVPLTEPVAGGEITVSGLYPGLETGHRLVITGTRADLYGASVQAGEPIMVAAVSQGFDAGDQPYTTLTLPPHAPLSYSYQPDTVTLYGNVVPAHQGATITETLTPAGNPANPTFTLAQTPVLADPSTQSGYASSLTLVIDGRIWTWVPRLDDRTPPRCYITGSDGQGRTTITLGQPLPQPASTVTATYRSGAGGAGNVQAGQLTQPLTRPLAVATVTNPLPASGGSGPDGPDTVRANAPCGLGALGRVVSVDDAADITMAWAGIGKSQAALGSDGQRDIVTVTVAGTSPTPLESGSGLLNDLGAALTAAGDVTVPIHVVPAAIMLIVLVAQIQCDPDFTWDTVEPAVRAELLDAYSYAVRGIDDDIIISDVIAVIHRVDGVVSCTITGMGLVPYDASPDQLATFTPSAPDTGQVRVASGTSIKITNGQIPVTGVAYLSDTVADTLILQGA